MKRATMFVVVCVLLLVPSAARADDGGWLDWLWRFDPTFRGAAVDFHVLCLASDGRSIQNDNGQAIFGCEEWFRNLFHPRHIVHTFNVATTDANGRVALQRIEQFDNTIRHEFDVRTGYYRSVGSRYDNTVVANPDEQGINMLKLMGVYRLHFTPSVALESGAGYLIFWGEGDQLKTFKRAVLSIGPVFSAKALELATTVNILPAGLSASDFGDVGPNFTFSHKPEWNVAITAGFDLRHVGCFRNCGP